MTRIDEISRDLYRISTPVPVEQIPGGFSFNQYLLVDDEPLLFHTGMRSSFPGVRAAIERVMPLDRLRWVSFGHVEADECGALAEVLAAAPQARRLCGRLQAMLEGEHERPPLVLGDGETHSLGRHRVRWIDAPHVPHGWDNGLLFDEVDRTLLAGDLFSQPGAEGPAVTESEVLGPSESMRGFMDYYAHGPNTRPVLERLAGLEPRLLACMHGSAYRGDGSAILRALADALG
jgi:flavorubredoxin